MRLEVSLFLISAVGFAVFFAAALIVFGVCAPRYLRLHGAKLYPPSRSRLHRSKLFLDDYRRCRQIVRAVDRKPGWLHAFEWLHGIAIAFALVLPVWVVVATIREWLRP